MVWSILFLINIFTAIKESQFYYSVLQLILCCMVTLKVSLNFTHSADYIQVPFDPLRYSENAENYYRFRYIFSPTFDIFGLI